MMAPKYLPMGYAHPGYAESLSEFGTPFYLQRSGGSILLRDIPHSDLQDAMGPYPLFACQNWGELRNDLDALEGKIVSLAMVPDPFGDYDEAYLRQCFPDVVIPFKKHFVVDFTTHYEAEISKGHRYKARKALRRVSVEVHQQKEHKDFSIIWDNLYDNLRKKFNLAGVKAFSRYAFEKQLSLPGLTIITARVDGKIVAAYLWYVMGNRVYYHLGASNSTGYQFMASYAIIQTALDYFSKRVRMMDLGAGAGLNPDADDGLTRFKRGWTRRTRTAYFCGRIYNQQEYARLSRLTNNVNVNYFPAYRNGEFS